MPQFEEFIKKLLDKAGRLVGDVLKQAALVFLQKHFDGWVKKHKAPLNELKWKVIEPTVDKFIKELDSVEEIKQFAQANATVRAPHALRSMHVPSVQNFAGWHASVGHDVRAPRAVPPAGRGPDHR